MRFISWRKVTPSRHVEKSEEKQEEKKKGKSHIEWNHNGQRQSNSEKKKRNIQTKLIDETKMTDYFK